MKKLLIAVLIISIIILLIDIVSVILVNLKISDGVGFIKEIIYLTSISIAVASIISIVISIIKLKRM